MLHRILMCFAALIRFVRRWLIRLSLVIFLVALNIATLVSSTVYDIMSRMVWGAVEVMSDNLAERRPNTKAELDAAKRQVGQAQSKLDEARVRNTSLIADLETKERRVAALSAEVEATRRGKQQALDAASGLRTRVVNSIRRDASTEAIGAVPFIGTAVFLGSVAYELNDACQQLRELDSVDAALRGRDAAPLTETMCLMSYEDMVAALTGQDRAYAKCVSDRIAMNDLNPPSCVVYDPALPAIKDSTVQPSEPVVLLPSIN